MEICRRVKADTRMLMTLIECHYAVKTLKLQILFMTSYVGRILSNIFM